MGIRLADLILPAYRHGIFPMADSRRPGIDWVSPDPRGILPLDGFRASRSLRRSMRRFRITLDRDFEGVIDGCAERAVTWITPPVREAYVELHRRGDAHSVEAWDGGALAGGTYGVAIGGAFMAESMFHRRADAGKAALSALVDHLRGRRFELLDIQMVTPHTASLGGVEIPRAEYLARLREAIVRPARWA